MTIAQIKEELTNKGISFKGVTKKQELLMLIPEYAEARKKCGYLTERGLYWLKISISNSIGWDKLLFEERIQMAERVLNKLSYNWEAEAESPLEFRNAIEDYHTYLEGKPVNGFVYLDATNQAFQLYAVLTSDKQTAELCNLANGETLADAYGEVADTMNTESNLECFNRKNCKKAVMTTLYSKADV